MAALFGSRLRRLRLSAGLTQAELGLRANTHSTRINQIERTTGAKPTLELARALDEAVGAEGLLIELWPYVYRETFPDWSRAFMEKSQRAVVIRQFMAAVVPGLLQTEDYARDLLRLDRSLASAEQLEERVAARLGRQARLEQSDGPELWAVLDEAVLARPLSDPAVMRAQFAGLLTAAADPRITLQVLPFRSGGHDAMGGSLTVLTMPDGSEVAYTEGSDYGQLIEDPQEVKSYSVAYDRLRALALPPNMSLDMIRSAMEDTHDAERVPSRSARRRLAQVQLQQSGGRRLRGGRRQRPRPRPRP
ncbi:helix-turn-helix domain-containing protein [Streptomyces inhibens]|uniref:helix-turn-helix domain-containing protein n=1 Tax=Streptomyces inhibens TaxID=2293571 RepID=UPI001EE77FC4|nr:helix-turn-helix transcriptional regulator [Streptomyces inhibens]UKY55388.1 helix-turn-helix transcriptional regulator [Streptomyces inhibens]